MRDDTRSRRSERGFASVLIVGVATVLLLFLGISVDWGILLRHRRAMQNACDSGSMAGALNLRSDPGSVEATAVRYARQDLTQNAIPSNPPPSGPPRSDLVTVTAQTQDVNGLPDTVAPRQVRVEMSRDVQTYLFRLVRNFVTVRVDCTARMVNIILTEGLVPLGLNYTAWDDYVNTQGCLPVIQAGVPLEDRTPPCDSFTITMSVSNSSNPWGSGNTGTLAMCPPGESGDCRGARDWREAFIQGSGEAFCYDAAQTANVTDVVLNGEACANILTEPGNMSGPVRFAVDARCDSGNPQDRIIMIPLLNPAYTSAGGGRYNTEVWGFSAFELDCLNRPQGGNDLSIQGGFVNIVTMQAFGRQTEFDTGVYTVRLVE